MGYLKSTLIVVPVTVAVLDVFGHVARVEGASMQVSSYHAKKEFISQHKLSVFRSQDGNVSKSDAICRLPWIFYADAMSPQAAHRACRHAFFIYTDRKYCSCSFII